MTLFNKLKWVLGILIVFVLIITTNLIDRNNFVRVRDAVSTIYEDRIIANDLIFDMQKLVYEKELAVTLSDSVFLHTESPKYNADLQALISRFEQTKLTPEEARVFEDLKTNLEVLYNYDVKTLQSTLNYESKIAPKFAKVKANLDDLSKIQLREGRRQKAISKKAIDTVELFTDIEIYILVVLAIIVQVIVMYNPKEKA
ncbi:MCP four helix bundle domain-containing protein [Tamlana sp. s12]|uniref:MCP four helix bundle domain-containing protein n=1 Tax=Tamlana sp. s12 TaxID=1630406 RepID=UPI0007FD8479|nr:MCP four helix bundle domain-containing protein [Tamlana sp. s12]OBQ54232.1 chemotaxis protein [Tamlana sp. s12]QQY81245.1 MCP four helix bundle domain-containing protein [Tamlana sp. s12]